MESSLRDLFHKGNQRMTASKLEKHLSQAFKNFLNLGTQMPISQRNYSSDSSVSLWHLTEVRKKGSETGNSSILKIKLVMDVKFHFSFSYT